MMSSLSLTIKISIARNPISHLDPVNGPEKEGIIRAQKRGPTPRPPSYHNGLYNLPAGGWLTVILLRRHSLLGSDGAAGRV